jgi:hypothetical protein
MELSIKHSINGIGGCEEIINGWQHQPRKPRNIRQLLCNPATTRCACMANRFKSLEIDNSTIGALPLDDVSKVKFEKVKGN